MTPKQAKAIQENLEQLQLGLALLHAELQALQDTIVERLPDGDHENFRARVKERKAWRYQRTLLTLEEAAPGQAARLDDLFPSDPTQE